MAILKRKTHFPALAVIALTMLTLATPAIAQTNKTKHKVAHSTISKKTHKTAAARKVVKNTTRAVTRTAAPKATHNAVPRLASASAVVVDTATGQPLFAKDANTVRSIASITKLMTAMVVLDAKLPLDEIIDITEADIDRLKHTTSRLPIGTKMARHDMLRLALMSSENRAASALAQHYPGGKPAFIAAMQNKARALGMVNSHFVDSTGLNANNVSTAEDLVKMVRAAGQYPLIKQYTTTAKREVLLPKYRAPLEFKNTNALVRGGKWNITVSKTGYTEEAGRNLVMLTQVGNRQVVMVLLDSQGKLSPVGDATRCKKWLENGKLALTTVDGSAPQQLVNR